MTVSVLSILKSPMILMGIVTMGIVFGMPYLMDNSTFYTFQVLSPSPFLLIPSIYICIYMRVYHIHETIETDTTSSGPRAARRIRRATKR